VRKAIINIAGEISNNPDNWGLMRFILTQIPFISSGKGIPDKGPKAAAAFGPAQAGQ